MRFILLCCTIFLATTLHVSGQIGEYLNSEYYKNFIPQKSKSATLGTFGNVPINYFTGLPEVSIPLLTLKGRELEVPISLSYDASGVRTDEISGPVGIKWSLNAGGYIYREMNGLPDEDVDNGYWKYSNETNYFNVDDQGKMAWSDYSQKNERDGQPDEFSINILGRTIKFVFNKSKQAVPIPREKVSIAYELVNNKIDKFTVITEDGIKYVFGGSTSIAVEETMMETLSIGFRYNMTQVAGSDLNNGISSVNESNPITHEKVIGKYNSKWHLVSITTPSGETMTFTYAAADGDVVYATRPSAIRVFPLGATLNRYVYNNAEKSLPVVLKFPASVPGSAPAVPPMVLITEPTTWFDPVKYKWTPGSVNLYHTIITENSRRLVDIKSSTNRSIVFAKGSPREDLPNGVRYDLITLYNGVMGEKSVKLNYTTQLADEANDYFWVSEARLMKELGIFTQPGTAYYANFVKAFSASQVSNPLLRKYVYEGLRDYNYKRLFLQSIEEVPTGATLKPIKLYEFQYESTPLKRRTTMLHDGSGFARSNSGGIFDYVLQTGKAAKVSQGITIDLSSNRVPLSGILTRMKYPTGGSTKFVYYPIVDAVTPIPKLQFVQDLDENDLVTSQKEIEYLHTVTVGGGIFTSYEDFLESHDGENSWMKYQVISTTAQNESFVRPHGVVQINDQVKVYHGVKAGDVNTGFEIFKFKNSANTNSSIYSIPAENNGVAMTNIFPFPKSLERDYFRGQIELHQVFKKGGVVPIQETAYVYDINILGYKPEIVWGFKGGSFTWKTSESVSFWRGLEVNAEQRYRFARNSYSSDWIVLTQKKETVYDQSDLAKSAVTLTDFSYDKDFMQVVQTSTTRESDLSTKIIAKTKFTTHDDYIYPKTCVSTYVNCKTGCAGLTDSGDIAACLRNCENQLNGCMNENAAQDEVNALVHLRKANQLSTAVETSTFIETAGVSKLQSAVCYKFINCVNGSIKYVRPKEVWGMKGSAALEADAYKESSVPGSNLFVIDSRMRRLHAYSGYDVSTGNVLQQTSLDGTVSAYVWDPTSKSLITDFTANPGASSHTTTYTYGSGGLSAVTDPNGIATSFFYDGFQRLRYTKDNENNILGRFRYHYYNENDDLNADLSIQGSPYVEKTLTFASAFDYPGDFTVSYKWDFGDGIQTTTTTSSTTHSFTAAGTYSVTLTVSSTERNPISISKQITIHPKMTVSMCADGPTQVNKCSQTVLRFGTCASSVNNSYSSPTILKATGTGGCITGAGTVSYRWEFQRVCGGTVTIPWSAYNTTTVPSSYAPEEFGSRTTGSCGTVYFNVRVILIDKCGGESEPSSVTQLTVVASSSGC
ncbi:PKD domain-containing protein [Chryseolinea lacunae]|uniref:PKD domain-containing protein n=1 Tax=Chryseolinea lacunae TaxID=2801331 RepID=A0ABS1KUW1_9BACT|nr:PKD domain-containing protein [Chryseolinea lacunae]MBL0743093.1 PKD domain-containing protein [Chryseolinea lacunae]